ncbi:unnamed protein product [Agarophyton chilense]
MLRLSEFEYDVQYRPGIKHNIADAISRLNSSGLETEPVDDDIPCFWVSSNQNGTGEHLEGCWDLPEEGALRNTDIPTQILALEETNIMPVTREEFLREQAQDAYCRTLADQIGFKGSSFDVDHNGMYDTLKKRFYWPHMAHDVYNFVRQCESCVRFRGGIRKHRKYLKLFPATGPLEFVAIDLLGQLPKTKNGYQHILVITDGFSKLTRAIPFKETKSTTLAIAFLNNWVYPYGASLLRRAVKRAESRLTAAQKRYKADYDRRVPKVVSVSSGHYVYIDKPPSGKRPRPVDEADDEAIDRDINSKLLHKSVGHYKVLNASDHTVRVEQDGIPNTISIDRITVAAETVQHRMEAGTSAQEPRAVALRTRPSKDPTLIEVNDELRRDDPDYNPLTGTEMEPHTVTAGAPDPAPTNKAPNSEHMNPRGGVPPKDQDKTSEEFSVDRLVGNTRTYNGPKYTVRWYCWGPKGDYLKPPVAIPPHFRIRYWRRRKEPMPADG